MRTFVSRVLGGAIGLLAALSAIVGLPLLLRLELELAESMVEHGGLSPWGAVRGSLAVLIPISLLAFVAFVLLRFSFQGPKSKSPAIVRSEKNSSEVILEEISQQKHDYSAAGPSNLAN
jgi:hypothetical protein